MLKQIQTYAIGKFMRCSMVRCVYTGVASKFRVQSVNGSEIASRDTLDRFNVSNERLQFRFTSVGFIFSSLHILRFQN